MIITMEIEEIEAVLERVWELHDKLSDAIHSVSRAHFLTARKAQTKKGVADVEEAKSLHSIRTALEHLEDQLDFFHTVQTQQRAERDVAIARLEQSRLVLAMRLAEHHGKKHNVIKEAKAFVGDVREVSRFISPENLYGPSGESTDNLVPNQGKRFNVFNLLWSKIDFIKRVLKLDQMGGLIGNAALVALSMLLLMQQAGLKGKNSLKQLPMQGDFLKRNQTVSPSEGSSPSGSSMQLDVLLARG
ncbi:hypothetical protein LIER_40188 [Lithospermum erythrorhizon]|uniref:Plastid division protein PDV1 n=1 Tax=Lithospermum erythrorhizon TaxID=34254 RepID=A0AAV3QRY2_LITER